MTQPTSLDTEQLHALVPISATLGIRLDEAGPEEVRLKLDWRDELCPASELVAKTTPTQAVLSRSAAHAPST